MCDYVENIIDSRLAVTISNVILKLNPFLDVWLGISLPCVTRENSRWDSPSDKNAIAKIT